MCTFGLVARVDRTYCTALAGALKFVIIIIISQQHSTSSEEVCVGKVRWKMLFKSSENCIITHIVFHILECDIIVEHYLTVWLILSNVCTNSPISGQSNQIFFATSFSCCHKPCKYKTLMIICTLKVA